MNLTWHYIAPANNYNAENIFVIGSPYGLSVSKGDPAECTTCVESVGYFRQESERYRGDSAFDG